MDKKWDIVIIGSGMGGGVLARALKDSGARILILERGDFLPQEPENWSPEAVFLDNRYKTKETWRTASGESYHPGVHYWVGGNTKLYGAALPRLRAEDFGALEHEGGTSPAWPIDYDDLEPFYGQVEQWFRAHGELGGDPTEPPHSTPYPYPPVPADPYMSDLAATLKRQGLHPFPLPIGIDLRTGGTCIRCDTCDAFPCKLRAKSDAETCGVLPALENANVELWTRAFVRRLTTDPAGTTVTTAEVERGGERIDVSAETFVVACGAVNSAALLLRSASSQHPDGLANSSGVVGRNYMVHNNAVLIAVKTAKNPTIFQKSMSINDFYFKGPNFPYPLGNLQPVGKVKPAMLKGAAPWAPSLTLAPIASRSTDWWVMTEDLPDPENRVTLDGDGTIRVHWKPTNTAAHERFIKVAKEVFHDAGYPVQLSKTMGIETNSHQLGTVRFGDDPATSALDPWCKAHDLTNLYVVDGSFFPSSTAVNPALTIGAQAVRVSRKIAGG